MTTYGPAWQPVPFATIDDLAAVELEAGGIIAGQAFSTFPAPSAGIAGLILRANDAVFPAPGIDLVCTGTLWRPVNGSAVLAIRAQNPVTVQNAGGAYAEVLGPFPGGLIRGGHRLEIDIHFDWPAISAQIRYLTVYIGPTTAPGVTMAATRSGTNSATLNGRLNGLLSVLLDGNGAHKAGLSDNINSFNPGALTVLSPSVDFSAPWYIGLHFFSVNENATTITGATWSGGVATFTATAHTLNTGDKTTVAGITPSGYNVVGIATRLDANTFTIPIATDPGAYTSGGTSSRISNCTLASHILRWEG